VLTLLINIVLIQFPAQQAYVPVSARTVRLPPERHARLSLCLPLGAASPAAGLAVVLLHPFAGDARWRYRYRLSNEEQRRWNAAQAAAAEGQHMQPPECGQLALLASLAPALHRRSRSSAASSGSGGGSGDEGRLLEPSITAAAAFTLLPSGSQVGYSVISLDGLLGGRPKAEVSRPAGSWLVPLAAWGHLERSLLHGAATLLLHLSLWLAPHVALASTQAIFLQPRRDSSSGSTAC